MNIKITEVLNSIWQNTICTFQGLLLALDGQNSNCTAQLPIIIQGTESKFKVTEEMAAK